MITRGCPDLLSLLICLVLLTPTTSPLKGGEERNITTGLNWYFTDQLRLMLNYISVRVTDRVNPPAVKDGREKIFAARFAWWF